MQCEVNRPGSNVVSIDAGGHRERLFKRRDELVSTHLDLATSIARSIQAQLPPSFELDDLIQTANLALLKAATQYRPKLHGNAPFSAYARQVVRGAVLDSVRRRHYEAATRPALSSVPEPMAAPVVEITIDRARRSASVRRAVDYLTPREARVITMYFEGREGTRAERTTFSDIAEEMNICRDTVRKLYQTGITKLRIRGYALQDAA